MAEAKKDYQALTNIKHNGKPYKKGDSISLTQDEANQLLKVKAIAEPTAEKAEEEKPAAAKK